MNELNEAIAQTVMMTWDSVLGTPIESAPNAGAEAAGTPGLVGCIHVTGAEGGVVTVECSGALANSAASKMFDLPLAEVKIGDAEDALAELTNIIGGNFKGLLPDGHQLSLPTVVEGKDFRTRFIGTRLAARVGFNCNGQPLVAAFFREGARSAIFC